MIECEYRAVLAPPAGATCVSQQLYSVNREKMGPWGGQSVAAPPGPGFDRFAADWPNALQAADEWLRFGVGFSRGGGSRDSGRKATL
jgi:hypothetical protein